MCFHLPCPDHLPFLLQFAFYFLSFLLHIFGSLILGFCALHLFLIFTCLFVCFHSLHLVLPERAKFCLIKLTDIRHLIFFLLFQNNFFLLLSTFYFSSRNLLLLLDWSDILWKTAGLTRIWINRFTLSFAMGKWATLFSHFLPTTKEVPPIPTNGAK